MSAGDQSSTAPSQPRDEKVTLEKLVIEGEAFELELAVDDAAREKGLMHRTEIKPGGGMLFIFPDAQIRSFWMLNCVIDIDVIFLDRNGIIVALHKMKQERPRRAWETQAEYEARLKRYSSLKPAQFAIELASGSIERLKLKRGQPIPMDLKRLKSLAK